MQGSTEEIKGFVPIGGIAVSVAAFSNTLAPSVHHTNGGIIIFGGSAELMVLSLSRNFLTIGVKGKVYLAAIFHVRPVLMLSGVDFSISEGEEIAIGDLGVLFVVGIPVASLTIVTITFSRTITLLSLLHQPGLVRWSETGGVEGSLGEGEDH